MRKCSRGHAVSLTWMPHARIESHPTEQQQCPHAGHESSRTIKSLKDLQLPQALPWRVLPPGGKGWDCTWGFLLVSTHRTVMAAGFFPLGQGVSKV